ncbi:MAG TPA: FecR domain-containing protein, partial [Sunxiuqinia sp.]|nr:FecR domain-containing protein [Sunxiuqinia sp.]
MTKENKIADLVRKYLEDKCDEAELDELFQLFQEEHYQQHIETLLFEYWQRNPSFQQKIAKHELDDMLDSIHHQINLQKSSTETGIRRLTGYLVRAAAILFIPLLIGTIWYANRNMAYESSDDMISLETPMGSKLKTTLPDGTEVWQNAGTTIRYPAHFTRANRQVYLSGEAYFHVSSDKQHPFYVKTTDGTVMVTGTRFDVSAFPDDNFSSVVLEEGKVSYTPANKKYKQQFLKPDEQVLYMKESEKLIKHPADVEKYTSWINGKLIFRNDPLEVVVKRLERWYNADIVLNDPDGTLARHPLTMTIRSESLQQVLDYIAEAAGLKLEKEGGGLTANAQLAKVKYI